MPLKYYKQVFEQQLRQAQQVAELIANLPAKGTIQFNKAKQPSPEMLWVSFWKRFFEWRDALRRGNSNA